MEIALLVNHLYRNLDRERGAHAFLALYFDRAIHGKNKLVDKGEVNGYCGTVVIVITRLGQRLEQAFLLLGGDTDAGIAHDELDLAVLGHRQFHCYAAVAGRELQGESDERVDNLADVVGGKYDCHCADR